MLSLNDPALWYPKIHISVQRYHISSDTIILGKLRNSIFSFFMHSFDYRLTCDWSENTESLDIKKGEGKFRNGFLPLKLCATQCKNLVAAFLKDQRSNSALMKSGITTLKSLNSPCTTRDISF